MRESPYYQEILEKGRQEGIKLRLAQDRQRGRQEAVFSFVLRSLTRKFGNISPDLQARISQLPLFVMENLGEDLLDFTSLDDLQNWIQTHQ